MFENPFSVGMLVSHPALGMGRIVGIQGDRIHVYFHGQSKRWATKLTLDAAKKLLKVPPDQSHEWLDHLPPFEWNPREGAFGMECERLTHEQAVATFRHHFPEGFDDPKYIGNMKEGERFYKDARRKEWQERIGNGEGRRLLEADDIPELTRRLLHIAQINLLHHISDKGPLVDGLADLAGARVFFRALLDVAENPPNQARFEALVRALEALPNPGNNVANWPVTTVFPWLANPEQQMFFRPVPTQEAAKRLAFELNYDSRPNWRTYSSLLALSDLLLKELRPYGAKDFMDVQGFIFVTWVPNYFSDSK